jgi:hypothetical protein
MSILKRIVNAKNIYATLAIRIHITKHSSEMSMEKLKKWKKDNGKLEVGLKKGIPNKTHLLLIYVRGETLALR